MNNGLASMRKDSALSTRHSELRTLAMLGLSLLLFSLEGASQERLQTPQRPPASDFNVELINFWRTSYMASVPGAGKRSGVWAHGNFHRIPAWKPTQEVPAEVSALRIEFWTEEGGIMIEVKAYLGQSGPHSRPEDWEKLQTVKVALRLVRENETISVVETEAFGIEPFSVKVSRSAPWSIGVPEIVNKTQALTVTHLSEARPAYTLTVRNVSPKDISAISWYGLTNLRRGGGTGLSGASLIRAGNVFDIHQRFGFDEARPEDPPGEQPPKRAIVIAAVVFEDGTFEGEVDQSAEMASSLSGHNIQFRRAIQLMRDVSLLPADDLPAILAKLKRKFASLGETADPEVVTELASRFASASQDTRNRRIKEEVNNSLKSAKMHLVQTLEKFEYQWSKSPTRADLELWLKETIEELERSIGVSD
ncbi:MAG: hypothetical protein ABI923_01450 [bacterium]